MYEKFFSLDELPFDGLPDERFYYVGASQRDSLSLLTEQLMRQGAVCVLSGPSGSGKTTLVRMLIRGLPQRMRIITIDDPRVSPHTLLATLLRACGMIATSLETIPELTFKLRSLLDKSGNAEQGTLLIVDEAQGLSDDCLEQLRLISNLEGNNGQRISILLAGQDELVTRIHDPIHHMLLSRIKAFASVPALKRDEMLAYLSFRLQQAGCHEPLFTSSAIGVIYKGSKGLPRLVNSIADQALSVAFSVKKHIVSARIAKKAVAQVRSRGRSLRARVGATLKSALAFIRFIIPFAAFGGALAVLTFLGCYLLLPNVLKDATIKEALSKAPAIVSAGEDYAKSKAWEQTARGRELQLFYLDKKNAIFKSDAESSLIKIWGYARKDGRKITCSDLGKTNVYCAQGQGLFDDVVKAGRPAVLALLDEDLCPYYAVLVKVHPEEDSSDLLMGDHLFTLKNDYVRAQFAGNFTVVVPEFDDFPDTSTNAYKDRITSLEKALHVKAGTISDKKSYKLALKAFSYRYVTDEEQELAVDLSSGIGPYLFKDDGYERYFQQLKSRTLSATNDAKDKSDPKGQDSKVTSDQKVQDVADASGDKSIEDGIDLKKGGEQALKNPKETVHSFANDNDAKNGSLEAQK